MIIFLVDKEFIEERRRALKHFLEILCRHPIICESDIIKFFLTFKGTVGDHQISVQRKKGSCVFDLGLWG